jgi:outer membrane lipoprotein
MRNTASSGLSLARVQKNPSEFSGSVVVWGGVIMSHARVNDWSALEVAETPLNSASAPEPKAPPRGNFIAKSKYLDPDIYSQGRMITMAGQILDSPDPTLGQYASTMPVLRIREIHIWPENEENWGAHRMEWKRIEAERYQTGR